MRGNLDRGLLKIPMIKSRRDSRLLRDTAPAPRNQAKSDS